MLRIFNEFQCILFVLLLEAPISFNLWQQDSALGADRSMTTFVPFALPRTKDAKSLSWWGARPTYGVSTGDLCWKFVIVMNCTFFYRQPNTLAASRFFSRTSSKTRSFLWPQKWWKYFLIQSQYMKICIICPKLFENIRT